MATVILPESNVANIRTFDLLDEFVAILGATSTTLWPFLERDGQVIRSYGEGIRDLIPADEAAARSLEAEFEPHRHPGGIHSLHIVRATNNHLRGTDDAAYTFGDGANDSPFSVGAFVLPRDGANINDILSKWDVSGGGGAEVREWRLGLQANETCMIQLHDESAAANTIVASNATALTLNQWSFIIMTYDGSGGPGANDGLTAYLNGAEDTGGNVGDANYTAMEDTATPLLIGASDVTAAPLNEFEGRIALPFVCGAELAATQVAEVNRLGRRLLGL